MADDQGSALFTQMPVQEILKTGDALDVQAVEGFVEQPAGGLGQLEASQGKASLHSRREAFHREMFANQGMIEVPGRQRCAQDRVVTGESPQPTPKAKIVHRVHLAEERIGFGRKIFDVAAAIASEAAIGEAVTNRTAVLMPQAGKDAHKRRLATAVGALNMKDFSRSYLKGQLGEDTAVLIAKVEIFYFKHSYSSRQLRPKEYMFRHVSTSLRGEPQTSAEGFAPAPFHLIDFAKALRGILMAKILVLLRPREEVKTYTAAAIDKFKAMQNIALESLPSKNLNSVADKLENGSVAILFIEEPLQKTEINLLNTVYRKAKKKPYIITIDTNYEELTAIISKDLVGVASNGFSELFIFNTIRNLLTPVGQKLDVRYVQGIVSSVVDVIKANTETVLTPQPITEVKAQETPEEICSVLAFCGDGFLGSITVNTEKALMTLFATKMLYCEPSDVNEEMLVDLLTELSNQIVGAVRNGLSEFGYRLSTTMQAVVLGESFLKATTSNGRYYTIPFQFEGMKFNIVLCYNTYQTSIHELEEEAASVRHGVLDVRLVRSAVEATTRMFAANTQENLKKGGVTVQKALIYQGNSIHLLHAASWQAKILLALEIKRKDAEYILSQTMGFTPEAIDDSTINDYFGEILNQIAGDLLKGSKKMGYHFQRVYQGKFSGTELHYNLKNRGLYFRQALVGDNVEIGLIFGADSSFAEEYFNIWPYFQQVPGFS